QIPFPASVLTSPKGDTARTLSLPSPISKKPPFPCPASATYTHPRASTAMPHGTAKRAALPEPSANPCVDPARVVTTPADIFRIRALPVSATYRVPAVSTATALGELN